MENNNRRNFLKAGAVLSGSLLLSPASGFTRNSTTGKNEIKDANIKQRTLGTGKHSIKVSAVGLGCMGMSWNRSFVPDKKSSIAVIRKAYDMGVTLFDTAEAYGPFANEELVGEAIASFRKNIILCSKFGFNIQNGKMPGGFNSKPQHIREVVEQSLKRLKTDVIDLLYQHRNVVDDKRTFDRRISGLRRIGYWVRSIQPAMQGISHGLSQRTDQIHPWQ